jgi:hypothetical protein
MDKNERALLEIKVRDLTNDGFLAGWKEMDEALTSLISNCERRIIIEDDEKQSARLKVLRREAIRLKNMPGAMVEAIRAALNADATADPVDRYVQDLVDGKNIEAMLNFAGSPGVKQEKEQDGRE